MAGVNGKQRHEVVALKGCRVPCRLCHCTEALMKRLCEILVLVGRDDGGTRKAVRGVGSASLWALAGKLARNMRGWQMQGILLVDTIPL